MSDDKGNRPWRVGRSVGRTIYDTNDVLIGMMDTPDLAAAVVDAVNKNKEEPKRHEWEAGRCVRCEVRWHEQGTGAWFDPCVAPKEEEG